jgi:hypothetical protein
VSRRRVLRLLVPLVVLLSLVAVPEAIAADGEGLYGRTDDKVITFFAFGVIGFFAVLVIVLSLIQIRLESRKERLHRDLQRFGR